MTAADNPECTQSEASKQQVSAVTQRPVSREANVTACDRSLARNPRRQTTNVQSISSNFQTQRRESLNESNMSLGSSSDDLSSNTSHNQLSSPNLSPGPAVEPFNHHHLLPSRQEHVSSASLSYVDCEQVQVPPDSTVQESDLSGFGLNTETRLCDTVDDGGKVDESSDNLEPNSKDSVEVQFNPEEFNFDIGKLILLSQEWFHWLMVKGELRFSSSLSGLP